MCSAPLSGVHFVWSRYRWASESALDITITSFTTSVSISRFGMVAAYLPTPTLSYVAMDHPNVIFAAFKKASEVLLPVTCLGRKPTIMVFNALLHTGVTEHVHSSVYSSSRMDQISLTMSFGNKIPFIVL